ncbi:DUF599 domain-containing protein [Paracidovorax citrulli]|uniref:DUF599 family protein n=2 Tax=Paracidovorax citrulli TaxID=80869 RepID=A1TWB1_PARC0|nr:DUF599 domain-containing protein [Paracidovorax citrulli]ABM35249.1 protein of unknown function DUF599 [Paracidovorax citrulli AAC00-1]ATG96246.1 DUF599 domain-containing protein [Paracidovorax citrulli]MVT37682.1 DUF599 family protein [Paracidovorax citrulli]PVY64705.1 uncharacterized protein DUF599 [Paracidovorax citrulli]REG71097.1 uncharacterized protein DUF599 [Paracidovorax citrulli]
MTLPGILLPSSLAVWAGALATLGIPLAYEAWSCAAARHRPLSRARGAHAHLRADWLDAVSAQPGSEILAVQTLRNALMSATMAASTAMLGLMGTVGIAAPSLRALLQGAATPAPDSAVLAAAVLELALLVLLCASLTAMVAAVRHYHHAGFVAGMPVGSPARQRWTPTGRDHLHKAGLFYSRGLRWLILGVPVTAGLLHPLAGVLVAVLWVAGLMRWDAPHAVA